MINGPRIEPKYFDVERCKVVSTIASFGAWSFSNFDGNFYELKEYPY